VIGLYIIVILLLRPFLRASNEQLHLLLQIELFVFLLAANLLESSVPDDLMDSTLSVILRLVTFAALPLFLRQVWSICARIGG
jgi:hypothetical protein